MPKGVYQRSRRPLAERMWDRVERGAADECWLWTGALSNGYGVLGRGGRQQGLAKAHRVAYEDLVGLIPEGLTIDHLCRNRACVNPAHLEPVTGAENTRRGEAGLHMREKQAARTHCKHGHILDGYNVRVRPSDGTLICRTCCRERERRYAAARRLA